MEEPEREICECSKDQSKDQYCQEADMEWVSPSQFLQDIRSSDGCLVARPSQCDITRGIAGGSFTTTAVEREGCLWEYYLVVDKSLSME